MWEQFLSTASEPWVMPGIAYGALWIGLIGLKLVYKKIKVKPPLADEQLQLFNYLHGLTVARWMAGTKLEDSLSIRPRGRGLP